MEFSGVTDDKDLEEEDGHDGGDQEDSEDGFHSASLAIMRTPSMES